MHIFKNTEKEIIIPDDLSKDNIYSLFEEADKISFPRKRYDFLSPHLESILEIYIEVVESMCRKMISVSLDSISIAENLITGKESKDCVLDLGVLEKKKHILLCSSGKDFVYILSDASLIKTNDVIAIADINGVTEFIPLWWFECESVDEIVDKYTDDIEYLIDNHLDKCISVTKSQIKTLELKLEDLEKKKNEFKNKK